MASIAGGQKRKATRNLSNDLPIKPPANLTILDNTLLFLPEKAVREFNLEANMNDKGDEAGDEFFPHFLLSWNPSSTQKIVATSQDKYMWVGRVWELRALLMHRNNDKMELIGSDCEQLSEFRKRELKAKLKDPEVRPRLKRLAARWRGAAQRMRCSFSVLRRLKFSHLRGTLIYSHGSGGCSWDNYRICRMICAMGILVIAPDGFAYPKETAMGQTLREKHMFSNISNGMLGLESYIVDEIPSVLMGLDPDPSTG